MRIVPCLSVACCFLLVGCSEPEAVPEILTLSPEVAAQRADSLQEAVSFQLADGLAIRLWASEPLVADPIGLAFDDDGRAYITKSGRMGQSEFDIRGYEHWMIPSISWQTIEDRRAFLRETFSPERSAEHAWLNDLNGDSLSDWRDLAVEAEEVYHLEDTDQDGLADRAQLFIRDFHTEVTDVAHAVLPWGDDVFVAVAPDVWRLQDRTGNGMADTKTSISHGYAVHIGFSGHGLSGLTYGPDGRLYWAIGDIGSHVTDQEGRTWAYPNQGAIFRSNPDGSDFEVFAAGVRNPHEFVFDPHGNLISVDNDGDHAGETERLVYLVNGSDSGWRTNWQFGKYLDASNNTYKVWMDEELFKPRFEGQAAYILPPVASYHSGPAGMAYNPGTALNAEWRDRFFVAEFRGSAAISRIFAFRLEEEGAGFRFVDEKVVTHGLLTTGIDFGPDGALYIADWVEGWGTNGQGRIWKIDVTAQDDATAALRAETQALLAEDVTTRPNEDLGTWLQYPDMRIRLKAQFELADRGAMATFLAAARQTEHHLARLHGLWGIGQLTRVDANQAEALLAFLDDANAEVRAQAAKTLGDVRYASASDALIARLTDEAPRVRFFATEALGRIGHAPAVQPILDMLEANNDEDTYLRHGGAIALGRIGNAEALVALADHPSRVLRIAAVVALRRMSNPGVARFLEDEDPYVVTEAARAIHDDRSIEAALPALAALIQEDRFTHEALLRRIISATLRVADDRGPRQLARFAARPQAPEAMRAEALAVLGVWPQPSVVDRVDGRYRGPATNDPEPARLALTDIAEPLLADASPAIRAATIKAIGHLRLDAFAPALFTRLQHDRVSMVRRTALAALEQLGERHMDNAVTIALADNDPMVRADALERIPSVSMAADRKAALLGEVVASGPIAEQQRAIEALGRLRSASANTVLGTLVDAFEAGTLAPALHLDLIEAVDSAGVATLQSRMATLQPDYAPTDVAAYTAALEGGSIDRGRRLYYQHPAAQCTRCHAIHDAGGDVGPALTTIGAQRSRQHLLESLVAPSAQISPGYGTVALTLENGETVRGTLAEETDAALVIRTENAGRQTVQKTTITNRQDGPSGMPPMGLILNRRELRDMVAFLASLQN